MRKPHPKFWSYLKPPENIYITPKYIVTHEHVLIMELKWNIHTPSSARQNRKHGIIVTTCRGRIVHRTHDFYIKKYIYLKHKNKILLSAYEVTNESNNLTQALPNLSPEATFTESDAIKTTTPPIMSIIFTMGTQKK